MWEASRRGQRGLEASKPVDRFRALRVAFTDLPSACGSRAPIENAWTVMEGPDVHAGAPPAVRRSTDTYRLSVRVYEYEAPPGESEGLAVPVVAREPAGAVASRLGLARSEP